MGNEEIKSGVLIGRGKFDWQAGGNSPIVHEILMPDKNWKKIELEHEIQFNYDKLYDTLFCVTYSSLKTIAKVLTVLESLGAFTAEQLKVLAKYKKNGKYNFSERFTGTLGETTTNGAYQYKIAQAIRNYGLIPQDMFPLADNFQDNIDKKFITQEMYDCGKEFLDIISINYEWVESVLEYLQYSPIPLIVRYANYEKPEDILKPEGELNHQVCGVYATVDYNEIEDTYNQRYKRYKPDYTHNFMAFYITINKKSMDTAKWLKENDKKWVQNVNTGQFGRVLQGKLMVVESKDRGTLMLLDDKMRTEPSIKITNSEWESLDKINF